MTETLAQLSLIQYTDLKKAMNTWQRIVFRFMFNILIFIKYKVRNVKKIPTGRRT